MKNRKAMIAGSFIGVIGIAMMVKSVGWIPALAVFLMLWGNNLHRGS